MTRATPRSVLFVPANDERKLARALGSAADLVVVDLEDAVLEEDKAAARAAARAALGGGEAHRAPWAIRINALDTPHAAADLDLVRAVGPVAIVVPMARAATLAAIDRDGPPLIPIVETPHGLRESAAIAEVEGVWAVVLGGVDLGRLLRLTPTPGGQELLFARSRLVLDSACAGIAPPIDVVHTNVRAHDALAEEARMARSLGFGGKACIHPDQIGIVQEAFGFSVAEIAWAERVEAAYRAARADGRGAVSLDGELVEQPVYERALEVLGREKESK